MFTKSRKCGRGVPSIARPEGRHIIAQPGSAATTRRPDMNSVRRGAEAIAYCGGLTRSEPRGLAARAATRRYREQRPISWRTSPPAESSAPGCTSGDDHQDLDLGPSHSVGNLLFLIFKSRLLLPSLRTELPVEFRIAPENSLLTTRQHPGDCAHHCRRSGRSGEWQGSDSEDRCTGCSPLAKWRYGKRSVAFEDSRASGH